MRLSVRSHSSSRFPSEDTRSPLLLLTSDAMPGVEVRWMRENERGEKTDVTNIVPWTLDALGSVEKSQSRFLEANVLFVWRGATECATGRVLPDQRIYREGNDVRRVSLAVTVCTDDLETDGDQPYPKSDSDSLILTSGPCHASEGRKKESVQGVSTLR